MKTIAIIGTHGKTSILYILELLFYECNKNIGVIGDFGVRINKNKLKHKYKYAKLDDAIKEMETNNIEFLFIELHEDDYQLENTIFDCIVFSDYNEWEYTEERDSFFRQSITRSKNIIINSDSDQSLRVIKGITNLYTITYGLNHKSTVTASAISVVQERIQYNYYLQRGIVSHEGNEIGVQELPVEVNLVGYQNIYNTLASITTALLYDLDIENVITILRNLSQIPNRLELIKCNDIPILIDMAKDSHSFKMLFETLQYLFYKKVFIAISIENLKALLKSTAIEDFIEDFSLIRGENISIIGELKENIVDKDSKKLLVEAVVKNKLDFDHFTHPRLYFDQYLPKLSKDDLIVWIGSRMIAEPYLK